MVFCHTCDGAGYVWEKEFPDGLGVKAVCPECRGAGYIFVMEFIGND